MPIRYQCCHCRRSVSAPDYFAGQAWRCPQVSCSSKIHVPRWGEDGVIAARWRVNRIYEGGMGWIYVAQDTEAAQRGTFLQVALKSFKDVSSPTRVKTFLEEARRWIQIGQHKHLVSAFVAEELEGCPFIRLEYVRGHALSHWIARRRISSAQAVNFGIQLCEGMRYLHVDAGVVHRDLKPSNLLIDTLNVLKVTDVGISQPVHAQNGLSDMSASTIAGTPPYMSQSSSISPL